MYAYDSYMCATHVTRKKKVKVKHNLYIACYKTVG